jgi:hypothetical protein
LGWGARVPGDGEGPDSRGARGADGRGIGLAGALNGGGVSLSEPVWLTLCFFGGLFTFLESMKIRIIAISILIIASSDANAFVVLGQDSNQRAWRWDAAARNVYNTDVERSLVGGLRYSVQGGALDSWYSQFAFSDGTTTTDFATIVSSAFSAWTVPDPVTGLTTDLSFVADFGTTVTFDVGGTGAEIDLFASDLETSSRKGFASTWFEGWGSDVVTLTSGVANHGASVIIGAQIEMNNNAGVLWTAGSFEQVLTHEIGHTLGLGDVDVDQDIFDTNPHNDDGLVSDWYDDNYDGTNATTQVASLSNSFAGMINPFNPEATVGLTRYTIAESSFYVGGAGEPNILMESDIDAVAAMSNDDFAGRQFLYPSLTAIPEPSTAVLLLAAAVLATARRRR